MWGGLHVKFVVGMSPQLRLKNYMAEAAEKCWEKNLESKEIKPLKFH